MNQTITHSNSIQDEHRGIVATALAVGFFTTGYFEGEARAKKHSKTKNSS
jgi:hypothetical protein